MGIDEVAKSQLVIGISGTQSFTLARQENPLMYIDVYFRILHAYTIIYLKYRVYCCPANAYHEL